jgi:protein-tyrosine phosphatase
LPRLALGKIRRSGASLLDRSAHRRRRAAAIDKLRSLSNVESVLFVCHGNIYRSPYAEAVFRSRLAAQSQTPVLIHSAGFVGSGRPVPQESLELALRRGLDLSGHRSQLVTPTNVRSSSLVVVMSAAQKREICRRFIYPTHRVLILGDLDPEPVTERDIVDPWSRPIEILRESTRRVERCTEVLVSELVRGETDRKVSLDGSGEAGDPSTIR